MRRMTNITKEARLIIWAAQFLLFVKGIKINRTVILSKYQFYNYLKRYLKTNIDQTNILLFDG